jgi:hypothetical protein
VTFVLIPGAGGHSFAWSEVALRLEAAGEKVVSNDLPTGHGHGLADYARAVATSVDDGSDIHIVAHSFGGFTAAAVTSLIPVASITFLNAMIPLPGEKAADWWDAVGYTDARAEADKSVGRDPAAGDDEIFWHDVPPALVRPMIEDAPAPDSPAAFDSAVEFESWPSVPLRVLAGVGDRFFPLPLQQRIARKRLGIEVEAVPGGHMAALAYPDEIAAAILGGDR